MTYCIDTSIVPPLHTHNSKVERVPHRRFRKWYATCYQADQALHLPPTTGRHYLLRRLFAEQKTLLKQKTYLQFCKHQAKEKVKVDGDSRLDKLNSSGHHNKRFEARYPIDSFRQFVFLPELDFVYNKVVISDYQLSRTDLKAIR